jgi:uncharacterized coiled-coil protein SlyX
MARGQEEQNDNVHQLRAGQLEVSGGGPQGPGIEARLARLEVVVAHLQSDLTEVKATLGRIAPEIYKMAGEMPHLATKAEVAKRPTVAGIIAIVALVAAVASIPIWPEWVAAIKAIAAAGR